MQRILGEGRKHNDGLEKVPDRPGNAAIVLEFPPDAEHAGLEQQCGTGVVDLHHSAVGELVEEPQETDLVVCRARREMKEKSVTSY